MGIPWSKINDYLTEIGSAHTMDQFAERALHNINRIIPFDANGLFVNVDGIGKMRSWKSIVEFERWVKLFNNHYWQSMPEIKGQDIIATNWKHYPNSEFASDFLKPQGIRFSLGVFRLGTKNETSAFTLHRSKNSRHFNETEQTICLILQPHLANFSSLLTKINCPGNEKYFYTEIVGNYKLLSKREAEVAILLCQRLTTPEIATKLMVSRRTVEFHIVNIYEKLKVKNRRELVVKLAGGKL